MTLGNVCETCTVFVQAYTQHWQCLIGKPVHACMPAWLNESMLGMSLLWHAFLSIGVSVLRHDSRWSKMALEQPHMSRGMERCAPLFTPLARGILVRCEEAGMLSGLYMPMPLCIGQQS